MFKSNVTTSVLKSIPRLVVDKVKLLYSLLLKHEILKKLVTLITS